MNKYLKIVLLGLMFGISINRFYQKRTKVQPAKEIHLTVESQIDNLDPATTTSYYCSQILGKVYEGLLEYHYLKRPYALVPCLAEAMPTVSEDGLTYTFALKKGVYFHDDPCFPNGKGRELVAEDFVYSLKRIADPAIQSRYFDEIQPFIKGLDDFHRHLTAHPGDYSHPIAGIWALDPYTLRITLIHPVALILNYLASPQYSIVAKEAVDYYGASFMNHPVGTGPFRLDNFNPQSNRITFVKNPTFRTKLYPTEAAPCYQHLLGSAGKKLPLVDSVVVHIMPEDHPRWLEFKNKKLDLIEVQPAYIPNVFHHGRLRNALSKEGIQLLKEECLSIRFIGFNCLTPPLNQQKIRQAMSLAFDQETYVKLFTDGLAEVPHCFIPSCFEGHDKTFRNPYAAYDVAQAKKLLAEAGYPGGKGLPVLNLACIANTEFKAKADFFVKCMAKIGIAVTVDQMPFPTLCNKIEKRQWTLMLMGNQASFPNAGDHFVLIRDAATNPIAIIDPQFNAWYDKAVGLPEKAQQIDLYQRMDKRIAELVPAIRLPKIPTYVLVHDRVQNYCIMPYHYGMEQFLDVKEPTPDTRLQ